MVPIILLNKVTANLVASLAATVAIFASTLLIASAEEGNSLPSGPNSSGNSLDSMGSSFERNTMRPEQTPRTLVRAPGSTTAKGSRNPQKQSDVNTRHRDVEDSPLSGVNNSGGQSQGANSVSPGGLGRP